MALYYQSAIRNLPEGYTFRGAALNDIPVVAYLFKQSRINSARIEDNLLPGMRKYWQSSRFNPALDIRLIFDQREHLIGYIEVWTSSTTAGNSWLWGCVHPDYQGRGIGTALLSWAEARLRLGLEYLPVNLKNIPRFFALSNQKTAPMLCKNLGWQPVLGQIDLPSQTLVYHNLPEPSQGTIIDNSQIYWVFEKKISPEVEHLQTLPKQSKG
jgi:GNAT superfamily N-acetyltransferase